MLKLAWQRQAECRRENVRAFVFLGKGVLLTALGRVPPGALKGQDHTEAGERDGRSEHTPSGALQMVAHLFRYSPKWAVAGLPAGTYWKRLGETQLLWVCQAVLRT